MDEDSDRPEYLDRCGRPKRSKSMLSNCISERVEIGELQDEITMMSDEVTDDVLTGKRDGYLYII